MKSYLRIKENSGFYRCALTWYEGGKLRRKEISTGIPIKGNNKRVRKYGRNTSKSMRA